MQITPNYSNYQKSSLVSNNMKKNTNFKGAIGDKLLKNISSTTEKEVLKEVKGTFGLSTSKVSDVFESFITKIKGLMTEVQQKTTENYNLKNANNELTRNLEYKTNENTRLKEVIDAVRDKNSVELQKKDKEIAYLKKYEAMAKVKSIDELGLVSPEDTLKLMSEVRENHKEMINSFAEYLFTGKSNETLVNQLERLNILRKSRLDGNFDIPEIKTIAKNTYEKLGVNVGNPIAYALIDYIPSAIYNAKQGHYILNPKIENQVAENAKSLIKSVVGELKQYEIASLERDIKASMDFMKDFYLYFDKGVKSAAKNCNVELQLNAQNFRSSYLIKKDKIKNLEYDKIPIFYVINWGKK